jgi:hypothetical protein
MNLGVQRTQEKRQAFHLGSAGNYDVQGLQKQVLQKAF